MELKITDGITSSQIQDLINYSNTDGLILKTTRDNTRFKDKSAYDSWSKKNRKIYTITDEADKLLGIIWFGVEKIPSEVSGENKYGITFAIRIYGDARGHGNAKPFLQEAFRRYKETSEYKENPAKGFWLETNSDNLPAVAAYKRFGFEVISEENGRILMILEN